MAERTTVRLPEELLLRAKRKALHDGRTLTSLLEEGRRRVLSDEPREKTIRRMPRVSEASGSFRPDLDDLSGSAREDDDLDYARHLRDGFPMILPDVNVLIFSVDAWFAALAIEWGCEWVTFDRDFARFPGLRWTTPR